MRQVDLNVDVGEGAGNDYELLQYVTSANIACGAHAGGEQTMRVTVARAVELGVAIGAHPGHADREHYGRRELPLTPAQAKSLVAEQLERLMRVVDRRNGRLAYLKPHGALYHQLARCPKLAEAAVRAAVEAGPPLAVLGPAGSCLEAAAREAGTPFFAEAFADRAYLSNGEIAPRSHPGALFEDESEVVRQALSLATRRAVTTADGGCLSVPCDSICLHGDTRWAVEFAAGVRLALARRGVRVESFAGRC
ncbi:LamB/YcsF family protein [Posidoniimonas corsicana]|uniref:LamB/YcsF family protein n=1 Tax=Posidoniimonas corsicana TaxID=1938618 RepID=A0A5C5VIT3_9BACT|nr:5-oxoprolinase subunit PxpA [Posidoniimonas corsicana]TWT37799.1 LamB/YcsF family protein [Posidoniimonas corsicana]